MMRSSSGETTLSKSLPRMNAELDASNYTSETIADDKLRVDQMVAAALKQVHELKQTHDDLHSSQETSDESPQTGESGEFKQSSPIKSGSSHSTSNEPGTTATTLRSRENKSSPISGDEQSTSSADGGTTESLSSGDTIVDKMVIEALKYAQDTRDSDHRVGHVLDSFHSVRTSQSRGGVSFRSDYSRSDDTNNNLDPWYAC